LYALANSLFSEIVRAMANFKGWCLDGKEEEGSGYSKFGSFTQFCQNENPSHEKSRQATVTPSSFILTFPHIQPIIWILLERLLQILICNQSLFISFWGAVRLDTSKEGMQGVLRNYFLLVLFQDAPHAAEVISS